MTPIEAVDDALRTMEKNLNLLIIYRDSAGSDPKRVKETGDKIIQARTSYELNIALCGPIAKASYQDRFNAFVKRMGNLTRNSNKRQPRQHVVPNRS